MRGEPQSSLGVHCLRGLVPKVRLPLGMVAIAQLVERQIVVLDVAGSSPVSHPSIRKRGSR